MFKYTPFESLWSFMSFGSFDSFETFETLETFESFERLLLFGRWSRRSIFWGDSILTNGWWSGWWIHVENWDGFNVKVETWDLPQQQQSSTATKATTSTATKATTSTATTTTTTIKTNLLSLHKSNFIIVAVKGAKEDCIFLGLRRWHSLKKYKQENLRRSKENCLFPNWKCAKLFVTVCNETKVVTNKLISI